jgi:hypothetical protein
MAFEVSKTGYQQIDPVFTPGYPYKNEYHNVGQLMTPYQGKKFGVLGDYGIPQKTAYYNVWNPTYPYPLDKALEPVGYIPGDACCYSGDDSRLRESKTCSQPCENLKSGYSPCTGSTKYIPGQYFATPPVSVPYGHAEPNQFETQRQFCEEPLTDKQKCRFNYHFVDGTSEVDPSIKEGYVFEPSRMFSYEKLRTANNRLYNFLGDLPH